MTSTHCNVINGTNMLKLTHDKRNISGYFTKMKLTDQVEAHY